MRRAHIVIAGAGYAGLAAYLALRPRLDGGAIDLTLVSATDAHLLLPELPLYLAGQESEHEIRLQLGHVVRPPARLHRARILRVRSDPPALVIQGAVDPWVADGLVVALGSVPDDFGVKGVREHATLIGRWDDARDLRRRLLATLASRHGGRVAIVGGGFTGVEIAAELADTHRVPGRIVLIAPHLLADLPERVGQTARSALERLGVELVLGDRAAEVRADAVVLAGGRRIPCAATIWAAGVRANPVMTDSHLAVNRRGQAEVDATLRLAPRVYVCGDCAAVTDARTGRPVAPTAQAALQQGPAAAANLLRELAGKEPQPLQTRSLGFLISLGREEAVGSILGHSVAGGDVAALKRLIETYHAFQVGGLHALGARLLRSTGARRGRASDPEVAAHAQGESPMPVDPAPQT